MLTPRQRLLSGVLSSLDGVNLTTFTGRLILQKRMFLLLMSGVDIGYNFSWYIRGPYSPGLTRDVFVVEGHGKLDAPRQQLPGILLDRIDKLRSGLGTGWNDPDVLELL